MVRLIGLLVCLFLVVGGAWRVVGAQDTPPPVATVVVESPLVTPTYAGGPAPATIPSPSPTATPSPTLTPTTTPTATPSETPTPTLSPTATPTATPTPTYAPFQVSPLLTLTDTPTNAGDFTLLWLGAAALLLVLGSALLVWGDRVALVHAGVKLEFNSKFPDENLFARVAQGTILFMPQTLHAAWLRHDEPFADGKLFFWAETLDFQPGSRLELPAAPAGGDLRNGVSGTRQRTHKTPSHPGQLPVNQLRTVLGEEVNRLPINDMQPATTSVWLPSRGGMPLARRGLLQANQGARSVETGAVTLQNWQISGLALPPLPALVFLSQLRQPGRRWAFPPATRLERLRMGNDLLYWSNAAKFVLEILIGQHYIPSVRMDDAGVLYALWQPALLDDRIKRRFGALVESMPAVCRAYALEQVGDALSPHELSEHFVGSLSDAAVRTWSNGQASTGAGAPALRWVQQLHASSRVFHLPPQPAHQLVQEWRTWIEQLHVTSDANFRITFELVEPDQPGQSAGYAGALAAAGEQLPEERTHWTLRYYLQARDDPRLLIAAVTVWGAPNGALRIGNRRVDRPQERLLAGLGAASRLFPPIERGLRSPRPELAILTAGEAHRFLREAALLLENNGFGVILPEWWDARQRTRLGLRLRLFGDQQALWNSNDDELAALPGVPAPHRGTVRYAWDLMLGAEQITQHEFERLAALDEPLLNRNGQWIELDPTQVSAAQRFLDERESAGEMSFLQSIRMAQGYLEQTGAQPPAVDRERAPVLAAGEEAEPNHHSAAAGSRGCGWASGRNHRAPAQSEIGGGTG